MVERMEDNMFYFSCAFFLTLFRYMGSPSCLRSFVVVLASRGNRSIRLDDNLLRRRPLFMANYQPSLADKDTERRRGASVIVIVRQINRAAAMVGLRV